MNLMKLHIPNDFMSALKLMLKLSLVGNFKLNLLHNLTVHNLLHVYSMALCMT